MPKLRRTFSSVSAPFCWPMTTTRRPSIRAKPATIASSSPNSRSPWSSTNSSAISARNSRVRGRRRLRASWTRAQTTAFSSTGGGRRRGLPAFGGLARRGPRMRSTTGGLRLGRREEAQELGQLAAEVGPRHDPVNEAVAIQELRALEARRQLLTDRRRRPTRAPANPISALGSARFTSPIAAYEANTPPVVGSDMTDTNGTRAARSRSRAAIVLASCISASVPSCIRAPPDAETMTSGTRSARAPPRPPGRPSRRRPRPSTRP